MEDLIAIQGKSVGELREIAKILGITEEKLSKKELIARISAIGNETHSSNTVQEPEATSAEASTAAPQKRKRARLGSVKVKPMTATPAEEKGQDVKKEEEDRKSVV